MWAFMRKFGVHYLSLPGSETIKVIDFMRTDVLNRIKETLRKVIPAGGHAFLYGSQARNEARPDSDWGILILLDKPKIEVEDYDNISYPLVGLGWLLNECVSPVLYISLALFTKGPRFSACFAPFAKTFCPVSPHKAAAPRHFW